MRNKCLTGLKIDPQSKMKVVILHFGSIEKKKNVGKFLEDPLFTKASLVIIWFS